MSRSRNRKRHHAARAVRDRVMFPGRRMSAAEVAFRVALMRTPAETAALADQITRIYGPQVPTSHALRSLNINRSISTNEWADD